MPISTQNGKYIYNGVAYNTLQEAKMAEMQGSRTTINPNIPAGSSTPIQPVPFPQVRQPMSDQSMGAALNKMRMQGGMNAMQDARQNKQYGGRGEVSMPVKPQGLLDIPQQPQQPAQAPSFMDKLTSSDGLTSIGSLMLSMSQDPSLQRIGAMGMQQAQANKLQNRTAAKLREIGRTDLADAMEAGLLDAKTAAGLMYAKQDPKVVGKSLVASDGKGGYKVLFSEASGDDATTAFNTLKQRAVAAGLEEGSQEFKQFMIDGGAKSGFALRSTPDGGFEFVQGGASLKPLNEGQAKATGFYGRMTYLSPIIDKFEQQGTQLFDSVVKGIPIAGNYLTSNEYKQYMYAKDNWIAAQLRDESGAAIGTDEYVNADKQYFPQIGDSAEVIEQKRQLRKKAEEAMKTKMGGAKDGSSTETPKSNTVKVGDVVNGYRFKGGNPSDPNSWEKV